MRNTDLIVRCLSKIKDAKGQIVGYVMQDVRTGQQAQIGADKLKNLIKTNTCIVTNLKLTANNRLIDCQEKLLTNKINEVTTVQSTTNKVKPASICGITIKNFKHPMGREGEYWMADVYYYNTKLGLWSQDANGAICDNYSFDKHKLDRALEEYRAKYKPGRDLDHLMMDLCILQEEYKEYLKGCKKGFSNLVVVTDEYDVVAHMLYCKTCDSQDLRLDIEKYKQIIVKQGYNPVVKIYKSERDFILE